MKWLFFIFLIGFVTVVIIGGVGFFQMQAAKPPSIKEASWAVQTYSQDGMKWPSRVYYTPEVTLEDGKVVIETFWVYDGSKYRKHHEEKVLPENSSIIRRKK